MMSKRTKIVPGKSVRGEKGQAIILVLLLMMLGTIIVPALLAYMSTGLKTGQVFENKTAELYAADAGIQNAIWQVKYDHLGVLFTDYTPYDYSENWTYPLSEQVNGKNVNVTINNVWMPKDITVPSEDQARTIIQTGKLIVTGSVSESSTYQVKITYFKGEADAPMQVQTLGVWLPAGFTYVADSSNLEDNNKDYYSVPVLSHQGNGQAVVWTFNSYPFAGDEGNDPFPGVNTADRPMTSTITFQFTSQQPERSPDAVSWITTSGVSDIPFSWDADTKIYRIKSIAGSTKVKAHFIKNELRDLGSSINGDYRSVGGTLMIDTNYDYYGIRDMLLSSSDAVVSDIPSNAEVEKAYLYWSAWRSESGKTTLFSDGFNNSSGWNSGSNWTISGGYASSHYSNGNNQSRNLTLKSNLNLSSCSAGTLTVSWEQWEDGTLGSNDGLNFSFSADGGVTWGNDIVAFRDDIGNSRVKYAYIVPVQYLTADFKIRFSINGFSGSGQTCYVDSFNVIATAPDTSVVFKIDGQQVYFDGNGQPQQGTQTIIASKTQVLPNYDNYGNPNGFSYACYKDVTALVRAFTQSPTNPPTNYPGNATYTVGSVNGDTGNQWSYAGWSLVIIYSSSETRGHQIYLYDTFMYAHNYTNIDFDMDGQLGGTITDFIVPQPVVGEVNAAKLTCFVGEGDEVWTGDQIKFNGTALSNAKSPSTNVWNSKSPGLNADGVDIDTFEITWASNLLRPGDTSAHIDLPTVDDSWNLVYIIVSFRSATRTGGNLSYIIE
jgi:hypothetical protein